MIYDVRIKFLLKNLKVETEVSPVSYPRLVKTMRKIRFKLQGKEDEGGIAEARKLAQLFLDKSEAQPVEIAEKRLNNFSENLFLPLKYRIHDQLVHALHMNLP